MAASTKNLDSHFYRAADTFFPAQAGGGLTFDDNSVNEKLDTITKPALIIALC